MTIATIVKSADVALSVSEFSLIKDSENVILGRLRFPPGVTRSAVRELIQDLKDLGYQIKKQQCIGDGDKTTAWSQLLFLCDLKMYQAFQIGCQPSNLQVVRNATAELLEQLEQPISTQAVTESEVECEFEAAIASVAEVETVAEPVVEAEAQLMETDAQIVELATNEQLCALTLDQIKAIAAAHNIPGRSQMTKNKTTVQRLLIPKLLGKVTINELS